MTAQLFVTTGAPTNGTNAVWQLTVGGTPTGGYFNIRQNTFNPVVWSSDNDTLIANLKSALESVQTIGAGNVLVVADSLTAGIGTINIEFIGAKAKLSVDPLSIPKNALNGSSPTVEVAEVTAGITATEREAPFNGVLCDISNGILYINTSNTLFEPNWSGLGTGSKVTNLSSADILALKATPIEVAPAPGAGKMIVPYLITFTYLGQGETAYTVTGGGNMSILWDTNDPFSLVLDKAILNATVNQFALCDLSGMTSTTANSDVENKPLMIKNGGGGEYTTGTGTAKITVYYNIVSVS